MWWSSPIVVQFWENVFTEIENDIHQNIYATPVLALLTIWRDQTIKVTSKELIVVMLMAAHR